MVIKTLSICNLESFQNLVRKGGFEPPRLSAPPPQDGVSASSTTSALGLFAPTSAERRMGEKGNSIITKSCLYSSGCGMIYFPWLRNALLKVPTKAGNTILRLFQRE